MDKIFDPQIVLKYTWTGVSRTKNEDKLSFNANQEIVDIFYRVVLAADDHFTIEKI